jgi:hypothetical protein
VKILVKAMEKLVAQNRVGIGEAELRNGFSVTMIASIKDSPGCSTDQWWCSISLQR